MLEFFLWWFITTLYSHQINQYQDIFLGKVKDSEFLCEISKRIKSQIISIKLQLSKYQQLKHCWVFEN